MRKTRFILIATVVLACVPGQTALGEPDRATGCLSQNGRISKVALGDAPVRPCKRNETEITWQLDGSDDNPSFFITLDDGMEESIVTNGPLEIFARCRFDIENDLQLLEIILTSSVEGWHWSVGVVSPNSPRPANQEMQIDAVGSPLTVPGLKPCCGGLAIAPDGSSIAMTSGHNAIGVNIFSHDCVAVGKMSLVNGDLDG